MFSVAFTIPVIMDKKIFEKIRKYYMITMYTMTIGVFAIAHWHIPDIARAVVVVSSLYMTLPTIITIYLWRMGEGNFLALLWWTTARFWGFETRK